MCWEILNLNVNSISSGGPSSQNHIPSHRDGQAGWSAPDGYMRAGFTKSAHYPRGEPLTARGRKQTNHIWEIINCVVQFGAVLIIPRRRFRSKVGGAGRGGMLLKRNRSPEIMKQALLCLGKRLYESLILVYNCETNTDCHCFFLASVMIVSGAGNSLT